MTTEKRVIKAQTTNKPDFSDNEPSLLLCFPESRIPLKRDSYHQGNKKFVSLLFYLHKL